METGQILGILFGFLGGAGLSWAGSYLVFQKFFAARKQLEHRCREAENKLTKSVAYEQELESAKSNIKSLEAKLEAAGNGIDPDSAERVKELENAVRTLGNEHDRAVAKAYDLEKELARLTSERDEALNQKVSLEEKLSSVGDNSNHLVKMQALVADLEADNARLKSTPAPELEVYRNEIAELRSKLLTEENRAREIAERYESEKAIWSANQSNPNSAELEAAQTKLAQSEARLQEILAQFDSAKAAWANQELNAKPDPELEARLGAAMKNLAELQEKYDMLSRESTAGQAQIRESETRELALRASLAELEEKLATAQASPATTDENLLADLELMRKDRDAARAEIETLREYSRRYEQLRGEVDSLRTKAADLDALQQSFDASQGELDDLRKEFAGVQTRFEATHNELDKTLGQLEDARERAKNADAKLEELRAQLSEKNRTLDELSTSMANAEKNAQDLKAQLDAAQNRLSLLESENKDLQPLRDQVAALNADLGQAKSESREQAEALAKLNQEVAELREKAHRLSDVETENVELRDVVSRGVATAEELVPLRQQLFDVSAALDEARRDSQSTREALRGTLDGLAALKAELADLETLRRENARLRQINRSDSEPTEFERLRSRIGEVSSQLVRTQSDAQQAREELHAANREIERLRDQVRHAGELGELS